MKQKQLACIQKKFYYLELPVFELLLSKRRETAWASADTAWALVSVSKLLARKRSEIIILSNYWSVQSYKQRIHFLPRVEFSRDSLVEPEVAWAETVRSPMSKILHRSSPVGRIAFLNEPTKMKLEKCMFEKCFFYRLLNFRCWL